MLNPRLDALTDYPFQRLRDLVDHVAPGGDGEPIMMSLGEPQHAYPGLVGEVLHENRHLYGKYPPVTGTPDLLAAIGDWLTARYGLASGAVDPERHVQPLNGTREGLFMLAQAVVPPTKASRQPAVLIPNPFYQCYVGAAVIAGAEPVFVPAAQQNNFLPDFAALDRDLLARTALVYLCSPSNPQGTVADLDYLKNLVAMAQEFDFVLAVDECYAEIYDRVPPPGVLQACAALGDGFANVMAFHSLSKRSSVPGLRSGFAAGDPDLIAAFRKLRNYGGAPSPLPVCAASAALWRDEAHVEANRALYREKFDLAERMLHNRFGFYRPPGGFFLWLDVGDGEAAAAKLWREAGVRVLPGGYLARDDAAGNNPGRPYIRIALVQDLSTTATSLERLSSTL